MARDADELVIKRYFFEERTQQSIAGELGVLLMHVSRIISRELASCEASFAGA